MISLVLVWVCVCVFVYLCWGGGGGGGGGGVWLKKQVPIYLGADNPSCYPKAVVEKSTCIPSSYFHIYDVIFK